MKFSLLKVDNPQKLIKLSKNKVSFLKKEDDVSLFHFNKFNNGLYHAVFNINDEYQIGTKKLGKQYNYPYSSLVNFFFTLESNFALVEYVNRKYQDEVINSVNNKTKAKIKKSVLDNSSIIKLIKNLGGSIKKFEYTNEADELLSQDFITKEEIYEIADSCTIDRALLLIDSQNVSFANNGDISVDNSDEVFLINFTKRIISTIE
ncbi:hypothetical protein [Siminovitchia sp. FSL W7-1587]|uniref:hypothetical protein n=1 Tax=Siminovitchia sp. FSL W7-1587 TaxID=2954699 RepID=UPI0030D5A839